MLEWLQRNWWIPVVRGVFAVLFGLVALLWPDLTVTAMVIVFGAFAIADGFLDIVGIFLWRQTDESRLIRGVIGLISILAGLVAFIWPDITALTLLYIVAIWAVMIGVFEIVTAYRLRQEIEGEWLIGISGLLSIAFGLLAIVFPGSGIIALAWLVGIYAIMFGVTLIALGFEVRGWAKRSGPRTVA